MRASIGVSICLIQSVVVADCHDILGIPGDSSFLEIDRIARAINSDGVGRADIDNVPRAIYVDSFCGLDRYLVAAALNYYSLACPGQLEC
jgi:hypothetical protein